MSYSDEAIALQLQLGEDSRWEFKQIEFAGSRPRGPSREDLADEIAAFANANGGVLLCSVTDAGEVRGMSREQLVELDALLVEVSSDSIRPSVRIRTYHKQLPDGRRLLLVDVPEGDAQHGSPGGSYVRVGGSKRRMTSDERLRLAQQWGQARFLSFDEQAVPGTGFKALDESLWKPLLSAEGAADPELALEKLALLTTDEAGMQRATVAGVLLCTRNPERWLPNACITATRYRGRDRTSGQIDAQEITGPLNRQISDAVAFAVRNMQVAARKEPARVDLPQYSDKVLFEALVNAVAHRDYSIRGSRIRLSMFADRLEIQSPGSLPNNLTVESMATRQATRNEALASVLGRMPVGGVRGSEDRHYFMERRGDGVPIIRRETRELCGKLPEYRLIDESEVRLIIPAAAQEQSPARVVITVRSAGQPLLGADLLTLFPNKTWKRSTTDENGEATVDLHTTHLPMTVFASAPGYAAKLEREWLPSRGALALELEALREGGSIIFPEATGHLPGLKGRLNPIRDTHDRTYLYASNVAINQGEQQPVHFVPGEDLRLMDAEGTELLARIVDIVGRSALVEYRPYPDRDGG
ncbi:MAG: putative DNA binding domain-containing protein [Truepera sp.]|nr:putative DNA binding domain-containing protein [Truepera sp.]